MHVHRLQIALLLLTLGNGSLIAAERFRPVYVPNLDVRALHGPPPVVDAAAAGRHRAVPHPGGANDLTSPPVSYDLTDTADARQSPSIMALATRHHGDPVAIYEEVRNTVFFEPYYGSRKGADLTLQEQSGSAVDIANVLVAAFRAAGHPARYVFGTVTLTPGQQTAWLGTTSSGAAVAVFQNGGVPASVVPNGGVQIQHAWAAVWNGAAWVQLDASFKTILLHRPSIQLTGLPPIADFLREVAATGALDVAHRRVLLAPRVPSPDAPGNYDRDIDLLKQRWQQGYDAAAAQVTATTDPRAVSGYSEILPQHFATLVTTLPLGAGTEVTASTFMPSTLRFYLTISIRPLLANSPATFRASLPDLAGKRITVNPVPATAADQAIVNQHGGTILNTPASTHFVSVIYVDGEEVARGPATRLDDVGNRTLTYEQPLRAPVQVENQMITGDTLSVAIGYGRTGGAEVSAARAILAAELATLPRNPDGTPLLTSPAVMSEPVNGAFLRAVGQLYDAQVALYREYFANALGVRVLPGAYIGYVLQTLRVDLRGPADNPSHGFGLGFDMPIEQSSGWDTSGSANAVQTFYQFTDAMSSALEHHIWDSLGIRALSAVRIMDLAMQRGIPIHNGVTKDEWFANSSSFHLDVGTLIGVTDAVSAGNVVTVPERDMTVGDWWGTGYIVTDPRTGRSGYIISGRLFSGPAMMAFGGSILNPLLTGAGLGLALINIANLAEDLALAGALIGAGGILLPAIGVALAAAVGVEWAAEARSIANLLEGESAAGFFGDEVGLTLVNFGIGRSFENAVGAALDGIESSAGISAINKSYEDTLPDYKEIVESDRQRSTATATAATPSDFLKLVLHSASPALWHDLRTLRDKRGWAVVDNLVLNNDYIADGAIEEVAHALAKAPDAPGGDALVLSASTGASYTEAYALQFAAENAADLYTQTYSVTYKPVTGFGTDGSPVFGQPRTESLIIPVEAYLRQWFFTQHAPVGPSDLRAWNTIMKLKAAVAAGLRDHVTFWPAGGVDAALQAWMAANAPAIWMQAYHDDSLR